MIARSVNTITAPTPQGTNAFGAWSDALGVSHEVTAPAGRRLGHLHRELHAADRRRPAGGRRRDRREHVQRRARPRRGVPDTAARGGPATPLRLYVDGASTASKLTLGLYADTGGEAGALLASATKTNPTAGAWNTVALPSAVNLVAGTHYWLGLLNPSDATGTLRWRDRAGGSGGLERTSLELRRCRCCPRPG